MDFLDNAIDKARELFDVASKKTNEVVTTQKQKFDVSSIENKRSKDFQKLGEIYYELIKDTEIENEDVKGIVEEITLKNQKIDELNEEINNAKNKRICPTCSTSIDKNSVFCSFCGAKLTIGSDGE